MNEILEMAGKYADAVLRKDDEAFLALYDEHVIVFDTWAAWVYEGREAFAAMVRGWFGSLGADRVSVSFSEAASSVDGNEAYWCGFVRYAALDAEGAELHAMENRLSWVLKRGEGGWRIKHEHTSVPVDFDSLRATLKRG